MVDNRVLNRVQHSPNVDKVKNSTRFVFLNWLLKPVSIVFVTTSLLQIKVCNVVIHLVAGWFSKWLKQIFLKYPCRKNTSGTKPLKKWTGPVAFCSVCDHQCVIITSQLLKRRALDSTQVLSNKNHSIPSKYFTESYVLIFLKDFIITHFLARTAQR